MSTPRDTSKRDPADLIAMLFGGSDAIYAQEAQGQREMVAATTLPTEILHSTQAEFETLGFTFGDVVADDPMFREATLPNGWRREPTDHSMWSKIVDERGIERVAIFYKAAFYDRSAHMNITNVGYKVATEFIYGDAELPDLHEDLTNSELEDARQQAGDYLARAAVHPDIYGDRVPRAEALLKALT